MKRVGNNSAFTLVECLVVMLTTILLASIVVPALLGKGNEEPEEIDLKPVGENPAPLIAPVGTDLELDPIFTPPPSTSLGEDSNP